MNREEKSQLVASLQSNLVGSAFVAVIHYRGMSDKQLYDLRVALKSRGCNMKIAKNTLVKVALKQTELEVLTPHLSGPTAVLYSQDPVALAKVISDMAKQVEFLKIKIAFFNKSLMDEVAIKDLAKLGSIEEVRASFLGLLSAKQANFVRLLTAPEKGLAANKTN
ncbi:MAG: 50S ribosomal protein L10 [Alphaproteobacteria bacterium]|nr:50S ribosomal protein L10 [Alphaproteobacteria bacterium]